MNLCIESTFQLHFFSLQVKCQILTFINSLKITYISTIWLPTVWERFIFQKKKNNCSNIDIPRRKLILWYSKKWQAMIGDFFCNIWTSPLTEKTYLIQLKNNQNQMKTTGGQHVKKFSNTAGWLSGFL